MMLKNCLRQPDLKEGSVEAIPSPYHDSNLAVSLKHQDMEFPSRNYTADEPLVSSNTQFVNN